MSAVHDAALTGQVAVVTGGGRGIGAAIAEKLAAMDGAIVICGRSRDILDKTAKRIRDAGTSAKLRTVT